MINIYKEIINNGLNSILENYKTLIGALTIPTIFLILINYWSISGVEGVEKFVVIVLTIMLDVVIAITVHRVILLGENSVPRFGYFWVGKKGFGFLIASIGIGLIAILPILLAAFVVKYSLLLTIIIAIATSMILSRLFLVFPAIASDRDIDYKDSWEYTKENTLLIFIVAIFTPFIIVSFITLIYTLLIQFLMNLISPELNILFVFLNLVSSVIFISMLSASFKYLVADEVEEDNEEEYYEEDDTLL
jgi:hypothetical protein